MYSHEIDQLLKIRNYNSEEYLNIIKTSPQIDHVKYDDSILTKLGLTQYDLKKEMKL